MDDLNRGETSWDCLANQWTDTGLLFTTELGRVVEPRNLLRVVEAAAKRIGLDGVGAHTLRHSAATAWLEAGVHVKRTRSPRPAS